MQKCSKIDRSTLSYLPKKAPKRPHKKNLTNKVMSKINR